MTNAKIESSLADNYRQGDFPSPFYHSLFDLPWRAPFLVKVNVDSLTLAREEPYKSLAVMARLSGYGSRRDLLGNPIATYTVEASTPGALTTVLATMKQRGLLKGDAPSLASVPADVQAAAALILDVALDNVSYRSSTFLDVSGLAGRFDAEREPFGTLTDPVEHNRRLEHFKKIQMTYLFAAGQDMAAAGTWAPSKAQTVSATTAYSWTVDTTWGKIVLSGGKDDTYDQGPYLLIIDTGGNDTYVNVPATASAGHWVSMTIDTHGNDAYVSHVALKGKPVREATTRAAERNLPGPACAVMGIAILFDTQGDDLYRSTRPAFGSATMGVAMVVDNKGNDIYDVYADGIGYGRFGLGLVEDLEGDDQYFGFQQVQGIGLVGGVGLLLDRAGNDKYVAEDEILDFPSAQTAEHNLNLAQGAGFGLRMDYLNGRSLAGGVGMLVDLAGDDTYSCGVFGQGFGYWMGTGILWDADGTDDYKGQWYVQGASAHFGIGYLEDRAGHDTYFAGINMAQGAGHDFGYGYLLDRTGNDKYTGANLSLGAGNANGVGLFADFAGNDTYAAPGPTAFGMSNPSPEGSVRQIALSLGVFLDLGGQDVYPSGHSFARNGINFATAARSSGPADQQQTGVFYDR